MSRISLADGAFARLMTFLLAAVLAAGWSLAAAQAADFPSKPIKIVVGFDAGGPTDVLIRHVAQDMSKTLGQPVVVENKPGANSLIATEQVARAAPDGYTLLAATLAHNTNPILNPDRAGKFMPGRDFTPVSLVATVPLIAVVAYESPIKSIADIVAMAKASPGSVTFGSAGVGGSSHLAGSLMATQAGVSMTHVPFKGNASALTEVLANRVTFMFFPMVGVKERVENKTLRALGVTLPNKHPDFPNVPTMAEANFPGFEEYTSGVGLVAALGTDPAVVERLSSAVRLALSKPEIAQRLLAIGFTPSHRSPDSYKAWLQADYTRLERLIKAAGIKQ